MAAEAVGNACVYAHAHVRVRVRVRVRKQSARHGCTGSRLKQRRGGVGVWGHGGGELQLHTHARSMPSTPVDRHWHQWQRREVGAEGKTPAPAIAALRQRDALRSPNRPGRVCEAPGRRMPRRRLLSKSSTSAMIGVAAPRRPPAVLLRTPKSPQPPPPCNERPL